MYQTHWGLSHSPFRSCLDTRLYYASPTHDEALARMHFLVDSRRRLGVLQGGTGTGKSMMLEVFAEQLRRSGADVVVIDLLGAGAHELVWTLADQLHANPSFDEPTFRLWRMVLDRLVENRYQHIPTVFLLDNADEVGSDVLEHVARLSLIDTSPEARLTIVLTANSHRVESLGTRLLELTELRIELESWEEEDTVGYIEWALRNAGREQPVMDVDALARLHQLSGGVPRRVLQLTDLALLAAAGQNLDAVDVTTVEAVYQELSVTAEPAMT